METNRPAALTIRNRILMEEDNGVEQGASPVLLHADVRKRRLMGSGVIVSKNVRWIKS